MRFKQLNLIRYGHFENVRLGFQKGASLHVVYGENEAGKTSALNAIVDLLYGFPKSTRYDFKFAKDTLLVGAVLENANGETISFMRRKGITKTISSLEGSTVLPEDALVPYLGAVDRNVFINSWGLSKESLRDGGAEMLKSEGEAGASLFAAASGLKGLRDFQKRLESGALDIFAPQRAQARTFYQAHDRYEDAAKQVRELGVRANQLADRVQSLQTLKDAWDSAKSERVTCLKSKDQLQRQKGLMPLLRLNMADEASLEQWKDLPPLAENVVVEIRRIFQASQAAKQRLDGLMSELEAAKKRLTGFQVDQNLLEHAAAIDMLIKLLGEYTQSKEDCPNVEQQKAGVEGDLEGYAVRLGLPAKTNLEDLLPSDMLVAKVRKQANRGRELENEISFNSAAISEQIKKIATLTRQQSTQGASSDPKPFREKLSRLMPVLGQLGERKRMDLEVIDETTDIRESAAQLTPPVVDLAALAQLPLPTRDAISEFGSQLETFESDLQLLKSRLDEAQSTVEQLEDELNSEDETPLEASQENIQAVRSMRDSHWQPIRVSLMEEAPPLSRVEAAEHVEGLEDGLRNADRLSDEAVVNAQLLADHAAVVQRLAEEKEKLSEIEAELDGKKEQIRILSAQWKELWSLCNIEQPLRPHRMAEWLTGIQNLLGRRKRLLGEANELSQIDGAVAGVRPALVSLAEALGIDEALNLASDLLLSAVENELGARSTVWNNSNSLVSQVAFATERLEELEKEKLSLAANQQEWSAGWSILLDAMKLPCDTTAEGASAAIDLWGKVPGALKLHKSFKGRIEGMNGRMAKYSEKVLALIAEIGVGGLSTEPDVAIMSLAEQLTTSRNEAAKAEQTEMDVAVLEDKASQAQGEYTSVARNLEALCVSLPKSDSRAEQIAGLEAREAILLRLRDRRQTVSSLAFGQTEDEIRTAMGTFDEEAAAVEISNLEIQEGLLTEDISKAYAKMKAAQDEFDQLQRGVGAEVVYQRQKIAEGEMVQNARAWAVKRFAQILLAEVVEQYRTQQEQPLLKRASELFSLLTGSSFSGIEQKINDDDTIRLVGRRNSPNPVFVDGMSEGTRDQLYFALRLAFLEEYAQKAEPMPFIGDDLLTSFDDERTRQGLTALAATGSLIQPILFTHHSKVVELARAELGAKVDVINLNYG